MSKRTQDRSRKTYTQKAQRATRMSPVIQVNFHSISPAADAAPYSVSMYCRGQGLDKKSDFTLSWVHLCDDEWRLKLSHWERDYYSDWTWHIRTFNMDALLRTVENHYCVDFDRPTTADTLPHLFFPPRLYVDRPCLEAKELRFHCALTESVIMAVRDARREIAAGQVTV